MKIPTFIGRNASVAAVYRITEKGQGYLLGQEDLRDLEEPD